MVKVIEHEANEDLLEEFRMETAKVDAMSSKSSVHTRSVSRRAIEANLSQKKPQALHGEVMSIGPDAKEVKEDDIVIFPLYSGTMVTVMDEELETYDRVFLVRESSLLACWRED